MEIRSFNKKCDFIINANIADILNLSATINPTGFKNLSGLLEDNNNLRVYCRDAQQCVYATNIHNENWNGNMFI